MTGQMPAPICQQQRDTCRAKRFRAFPSCGDCSSRDCLCSDVLLSCTASPIAPSSIGRHEEPRSFAWLSAPARLLAPRQAHKQVFAVEASNDVRSDLYKLRTQYTRSQTKLSRTHA